MSIPLDFLNAIGTSALPILAGGGLAVAEVGSSILVKVWEWWGAKGKEAERRKELEALATATAQELRGAVKELAAQIAADQPPQVQSKLEGYLMAVPAQIRRTLRRPSDTAGQTIPPDLNLTRPEHLAPLLPPRPPRFAAGDKAPGTDFELVELLGIGGFGEVWKARNAYMPGAPAVALKFCLDPDAAASLRRETALLDRIQREGKHPGIVELRHTFLSAEPPFLEYELVEGGDLGGLIGEWHRQKGGPSAVQAARVVRRLAETMAFAHEKRIVHRDLKPANILLAGVRSQESGVSKAPIEGASSLTPDSRPLTPVRLKIADFGIGGIAAEAAARQAMFTRGGATLTAAAAHGSYSLYYASPEQMRGAPPDPRDDVHALGVIWYQLLVGDLTAEAPRGAGWKKRLAAKGMSAALIELLENCVATDREDRPTDGRDVADRLGFILAEPSPGIDLDLSSTPDIHLEMAAPVGAIAPPQPTVKPAPARYRYEALDSSGKVVTDTVEAVGEDEAMRQVRARGHFITKLTPIADKPVGPMDGFGSRFKIEHHLQKQRGEDFVARLRQLLGYQDRLRWAAGGWAWAVQVLLLLAASFGAGAAVFAYQNAGVGAANHQRAQEIAARLSTPDMPIVWRPVSNSGYFTLQDKPSSYSASSLGVRAYVGPTHNYPPPSGGRATYDPVGLDWYSTVPINQKKEVEVYVHQVNTKLAEAVAEYNQLWVGSDGLRDGIAAGVGTLLVLGTLFVLVRRSARRTVEGWVRDDVRTIESEFAREMRALPEPLDLNHPAAVARMIEALQVAWQVWRPFPSPVWLWHRLFAPF